MCFDKRKCPSCSHADTEFVFDNRMALIDGIDLSYKVVQCNNCGLVFADNIPSQEIYNVYYHTLSKFSVNTSVESIREVDKLRADKTVEFCRPFFSSNSLIADLGCGSGVLLNAFQC